VKSYVSKSIRTQPPYCGAEGYRIFLKTTTLCDIAKNGKPQWRHECVEVVENGDFNVEPGYCYTFVIIGSNVNEDPVARLNVGGTKLNSDTLLNNSISSHAAAYKTSLMVSLVVYKIVL
jgi:hypothetical protein